MMQLNIIWSRWFVTLTILVSVVISGISYGVIDTVVFACVTIACQSIQKIQKEAD